MNAVPAHVIERIGKLDALGDPARNPNPHEASVARERADALRREWHLPPYDEPASPRSRVDDLTSLFRRYNFQRTPSHFQWLYSHFPNLFSRRTFVAGFRFYDGPGLIRRFAVGQRVYLVPRPDNPFDSLAIAVFWRRHMIGYIPRRTNKRFHRDLARGGLFYARISRIRPDADPWEALEIEIVTMHNPNDTSFLNTPEAPNHALQRTAPRVTAAASTTALPTPCSRRAALRSR